MEIPSSIKLYGKRIKIKTVPNLIRSYGAMGMFVPEKETILLDVLLDGEELVETLIHEIGHAMFSRISLNQAVPQPVEEIIVDNFANILTELFEIEFK